MTCNSTYLFQCRETCLEKQITIPLATVRRYTSEGELQALVDTSFTAANADEPLSDEEVYQSEEEDVIGIQPTNANSNQSVTSPQPSSCAANIGTTNANSNQSVTSPQFSSCAAHIQTANSTEVTRLDIVPDTTDLVLSYDWTTTISCCRPCTAYLPAL